MITEFRQTVNYAEIQGIKNYSKLDDKKNKIWHSTFNTSTNKLIEYKGTKDNLFSIENVKNNTQFEGLVITLPDLKFKNKCFFTKNHNGTSERFDVKFFNEGKGGSVYYTDKGHQIRRHFGNPFSSIRIKLIDKSITKNDDKISLKLYSQIKRRGFNSRYFKVNKERKSLTINLKTGDITVGNVVFRKNNFKMIHNFLREFFDNTMLSIDNKNFKEKMNNKISPLDLFIKFKEIVGVDGYENNTTYNNAFQLIVDLFIEKKKIKIPNNNVVKYLQYYYPTEKFFKKNDRKLVSSLLDLLNLKSKVLIKILHQHIDINHKNLFILCKMFGENYSKYIGSIKNNAFTSEKDVKEKKYFEIPFPMANIEEGKDFINKYIPNYTFTDIEKENVISLINDMDGEFFDDNKMIIFNDHLDMISRIRKFDPTFHFKSKNHSQFTNYHGELSKIIRSIRKGWSIEYTFTEKMVVDVETPITITVDNTSFEPNLEIITPRSISVSFYPFILKREEDYEEEGSFMHHCVATYSKKDKSIIISVRTKDLSDRVTCEYNCQDGRLIQARSFHNGNPPADMEFAIEQLTNKVVKYSKLGMLHAINKEKVPLKINGIEVPIENPSLSHGFFDLVWDI